MSGSCGDPRRRRRRRRPPLQSHLLRPRPRPQPRRLLLPPRRLPPQPPPLLRQMHRLLLLRPRRLPHPHRLPPQVHRLQRRAATRKVTRLQDRQRTVARRERIALPGPVAPHHSKTIARALSRTLSQEGSAAIPAWRGRVSVESAVATGAVVTTNLLPRQPPFPPGAISKTSKRQSRTSALRIEDDLQCRLRNLLHFESFTELPVRRRRAVPTRPGAGTRSNRRGPAPAHVTSMQMPRFSNNTTCSGRVMPVQIRK
jgi:hypothetical protein